MLRNAAARILVRCHFFISRLFNLLSPHLSYQCFRVPSFQFFCFGGVDTHALQRDHLPEDTLPATASQLPAGV